jgi:hypothetical protein
MYCPIPSIDHIPSTTIPYHYGPCSTLHTMLYPCIPYMTWTRYPHRWIHEKMAFTPGGSNRRYLQWEWSQVGRHARVEWYLDCVGDYVLCSGALETGSSGRLAVGTWSVGIYGAQARVVFKGHLRCMFILEGETTVELSSQSGSFEDLSFIWRVWWAPEGEGTFEFVEIGESKVELPLGSSQSETYGD